MQDGNNKTAILLVFCVRCIMFSIVAVIKLYQKLYRLREISYIYVGLLFVSIKTDTSTTIDRVELQFWLVVLRFVRPWERERESENEREGEKEREINSKQAKATSVQPCMVTLCLCLLTAGNCLVGNANHQGGSHSPRLQDPSVADNHQAAHQDHVSDGESHLQTLMPMQFSPLHIPQFHSSLNMGYPSGLPLSGLAATQTASTGTLIGGTNQSKARGASDCPGVCPLCGATLRQARNLRRHLLSSCKYRFNHSATTATTTAMQNSDVAMMEVKQEVEVSGYNDQSSVTYGTDSGSNDCEQIVCNPTLPSPTLHEPESVISSPSSIPSPTIAR